MYPITMAGPAKNALGTMMLQFLLDQLDAAAGRPILLTGQGDAFSAGLDLKHVAELDPEGMFTFLLLLERAVSALYLYPGPTVALVNGHAIAGGCVLTLACDHRIAQSDPRIKIGLNEVALGVRFPPRIFAMIRQRVPLQHLQRIILGAELFDPQRALEVGLIDEIADDPTATAQKRLAQLAAYPREAYAIAKRDLRGKTEQDLYPDGEEERSLRESVPLWTAPEVKTTIARVLKR